MPDERTDMQKLGELIRDVRVAMLTTSDPDGFLRSRPMHTQLKEFDGTLWFFTDDPSGKAASVAKDQHVNLAYVNHDQKRFISVTGIATIVHDRAQAEQLWHPMLKAYFPEGIDDPKLALLKVEVQGAEYWESPSYGVIRLFGVAKAALTGERYQGGTHERLDVRH